MTGMSIEFYVRNLLSSALFYGVVQQKAYDKGKSNTAFLPIFDKVNPISEYKLLGSTVLIEDRTLKEPSIFS